MPTLTKGTSVGTSGDFWGSQEGCQGPYPIQYSWVSLVAQLVKNLPAMLETWVQSLGWEDPLEEGMATHSSTLAWRIPMDRGAWRAIVSCQSRFDAQYWMLGAGALGRPRGMVSGGGTRITVTIPLKENS